MYKLSGRRIFKRGQFIANLDLTGRVHGGSGVFSEGNLIRG